MPPIVPSLPALSFRRRLFAPIAALAALATFAAAEEPALPSFESFRSRPNVLSADRFTFVRVQYDSYGRYGEAYYDYDGRRWLRWETDYPEADENFLYRLAELTTIEPNPRAEVRRLTDDDIFDFPFLYMVDVGWQDLDREEIARLREYLSRGGFLWVDDFWGHAEWENFDEMMREALPESRWQPIPDDHPVLNVVFPLKSCPQVPARDFAMQGWTYDPPFIHKAPTSLDRSSDGVETVNLRGYFDKGGRLVCLATHNTDIGDGWEREAEDEWYFETYSTPAYAMGINIVVYALTH